MSDPYRVFVRKEAFEFLSRCRRAERESALRLMGALASSPHRTGDYSEKDDVGRPLEVIVDGRVAVVFWADHPVHEIKIVQIRFADR